MFGRKKKGITNRPVAAELQEKSAGKIAIRWYNTHGEQFFTKLIMIQYQNTAVILDGSANLTLRNLGDFKLEADMEITGPKDSTIAREVAAYIRRMWNNEGGSYTVAFEQYYYRSFLEKPVYRFQGWSGMGNF